MGSIATASRPLISLQAGGSIACTVIASFVLMGSVPSPHRRRANQHCLHAALPRRVDFLHNNALLDALTHQQQQLSDLFSASCQ